MLWNYHNAAGEIIGGVVRWDRPDGKVIRPVSLHADGWHCAAMSAPRPLYLLRELAAARLVVVAEGEKAADAARSLGFVATTSAGGAQAPGQTDWSPLAGKVVWILQDNDKGGRKFAEAVAAILMKLSPATVVKIIELPNLPEKGDIVEWIEAHGDAAEPEGMRAEIEALAAVAEPWASEETEDLSFKPFPVDALPEPVRGFVGAGAKAIGCDPSYVSLPLLAVLAASIGTTRRLELKQGWSAPAIIWGAIVGESGTSKTPAYKLATRPLWERQRKTLAHHAEAMKEYEAVLARWEKDFMAWKRSKSTSEPPPNKPEPPACERYIVSDTTVEALAPILQKNLRGLMLGRDELNGWIGSFDRYAGKGKAGGDSAKWLSMHNGENILVDRKTPHPHTICIPNASISVIGGIQPGILRRALSDEHRESGLAARLLVCCPPRKAKRWTEAGIDPKLEAELARLVDRLFQLQHSMSDKGEALPLLVRMTADAKTVWTAFYNAHAKEQADLTGDLSAAWSKLEEYAARLALVVHYARWAAGEINDELRLDVISMQAGIALTMWFKGEARLVYAMLAETEEERDNRRLIEWIGYKRGPVTVREVQQGCRWLRGAGAAEAALESMVKAGRGIWEPTPAGQKGTPTRRFRLSTPSTVYGNGHLPLKNTISVDVDTVDGAQSQPEDDLTDLPFGFDDPANHGDE